MNLLISLPADSTIILKDLLYVGLLAGLFILPKILQRFLIPSAISALVIGLLWGVALPEFKHDQTVSFLSSIGILALFLLAGLEVDLNKLKSRQRMIAVHVAVRQERTDGDAPNALADFGSCCGCVDIRGQEVRQGLCAVGNYSG